jgi:DNA polymerase-3 subunit delta'
VSAGRAGGPVERALGLVRRGRLYPATILHGGAEPARQAAALEIARALLCERDAAERPCGDCRHCRRVAWPGDEAPFHPDFAVLLRDLKTSTSAEATREWLRAAHSAPFEARGQVFVIAAAETLSSEAGDALLKAIEEPGLRSPRHFLLLAPSRLDLPATLRSRSMALFLGPAEKPDPELVDGIAAEFGASVRRFGEGRGAVFLLDAAARLAAAGDFSDPRGEIPWLLAARIVRAAALDPAAESGGLRARLLALAEALLEASPLRLRGIPAERILEGLVSRHLAGAARH